MAQLDDHWSEMGSQHFFETRTHKTVFCHNLLQLLGKSDGCIHGVFEKSIRIPTIFVSKFKAIVRPNCLKACWWSSAVDSSRATAVGKIQNSCQLLQAAVSTSSSSHHHHHHHHYPHHNHHHHHHRHIFKAASSWRKLPWQTAAIGTFPTMQSMLKILLSCVYWGGLVLRLLMFKKKCGQAMLNWLQTSQTVAYLIR